MEESNNQEAINSKTLIWNLNYKFNEEQHSRTKYVIYEIKNTISGKVYIGQTRRELRSRWKDYKRDLLKPINTESKSGSNIKLKRSVQYYFNKLNHVNFLLFSIVEVVDVSQLTNDEEKQLKLDEREQFHIKEYKKQFGKNKVCNVRDGGKQYIFTEEDRKKLSESHLGQIPWNKNKKLPQFSGENHPNFGKKLSEETKQKISKNHARLSGENHQNFGKCFTIESKKKMSESRKGKKVWNKGKINIYSKETKKKMSESKLGKYKGINSPNSKIYDLTSTPLISPLGEIYTKIECLLEFCRKHNLTEPNLRKVLSGTRKSHKGWKIKIVI